MANDQGPIILPMRSSDEDMTMAKAEEAFARPVGAAEVVPIGQSFREPGAADQRLLDRLERMREQVASGAVVQIAFVAVGSNGSVSYGWENGDRVNAPLIGAVAVLQHAITGDYLK